MARLSMSIGAVPAIAPMLAMVFGLAVIGADQGQSSDKNMAPARLGAPAPTMKVTSKALAANAAIPEKHSGYSNGPSPDLVWSGAPPSTKTYVLIMEDPDAKAVAPEPFLHWLVYNIPAMTMTLPEGVPTTGDVKGGGMQGVNGTKAMGYFGPRPPAGDPDHHYHFEEFAMDAELPLKSGASKTEVLAAMQGRVLAWGELVGTYRRGK